MIERIEAINNPNFFFLQYSKRELNVKNLIVVPKHFFVPEIIEKRKPLATTARRAGWVGCNIILKNIPQEGLIYVVKDEKEQPIDDIINKINRTNFIKQYKLDGRGWILDILNCINKIEEQNFSLDQVYAFENVLAEKHPGNHHIKDKIRQQLQLLRDKGIIEFNGRGKYSKIP